MKYIIYVSSHNYLDTFKSCNNYLQKFTTVRHIQSLHLYTFVFLHENSYSFFVTIYILILYYVLYVHYLHIINSYFAEVIEIP